MNTVNLNANFQDNLSFDNQSNSKNIIATIFDGLKNWRERVKGRATIAKLNDHLLRDMGMDRPAIKRIEVDRRWMP